VLYLLSSGLRRKPCSRRLDTSSQVELRRNPVFLANFFARQSPWIVGCTDMIGSEQGGKCSKVISLQSAVGPRLVVGEKFAMAGVVDVPTRMSVATREFHPLKSSAFHAFHGALFRQQRWRAAKTSGRAKSAESVDSAQVHRICPKPRLRSLCQV
jgi:hypothetical protein